MTDPDTRIRGLLDELANEAHADPSREGTTLRRVRRRRFANVVASIVVVAGLATLGLAGIRHVQVRSLPEGHGPSPSAAVSSTPSGTSTTPLCAVAMMRSTLSSQTGAAGTIRSVWKATNTSQAACRSYGYPGMDLRTSAGWLAITVSRGGYPDISGTPRSVIVRPGHALYFVSYWSDATTSAGPCRSFDRVKVTMPNDVSSLVVPASGCADPTSVRVGPVTTEPPAA
ncbi:MAG: DUF4232 domain-containing protein [Actinomycetota bacterium]